MIQCLYDCFKNWASTGSVWIISDTHFEDSDCRLMDPGWIAPQEQVDIINKYVYPTDTFIHLGDVGNAEWIRQIRAKHKVLIMGNHDQSKTKYSSYFQEIYDGPLFISDKILLSHEPINLPFALNIHGHDHNNAKYYESGCRHLNMAANVCGYKPINLGKLIKKGILSDISDIHRITIDSATNRKEEKRKSNERE